MMTVRSASWPVLAAAVAVAVLALAGCRAGDPAGTGDPAGASDPAGATGGPAGTPQWAWELPHCVAYRPADYRAPQHRRSVEVHPGPGTIAYMETYEPGWGARAMAEIRALLRECGRYESGGSGDPAAFSDQHLVTEPDFAGDESLLVETTRLRPPAQQTWYSLVIRNGDVVTTVRTGSSPGQAAGCREATCPPGQA